LGSTIGTVSSYGSWCSSLVSTGVDSSGSNGARSGNSAKQSIDSSVCRQARSAEMLS